MVAGHHVVVVVDVDETKGILLSGSVCIRVAVEAGWDGIYGDGRPLLKIMVMSPR